MNIESCKIQDAGGSKTVLDTIAVYHTHGLRQYLGSAKYHIKPDCPVLVKWKPGAGLAKTIMREWFPSYSYIYNESRCKICWKL